jgi:hypothetical protein
MSSRPFVSQLLILVVAFATVSAQTGAGMLYPAEGVMVNGKQIATTTALFSGDKVTTAGNPTMLNSDGQAIRVGPETSLTFGHMADLGCGSIAVTASRPSAVRAGSGTVIRTASTSDFELIALNNKLLLKVKSGEVNLSDRSQERVLTAGQSTSIPGTSCPAVNAGKGSKPVAAMSSGSGKTIAIVGAAAAGAAAVGIAARSKDKSVSPSRP